MKTTFFDDIFRPHDNVLNPVDKSSLKSHWMWILTSGILHFILAIGAFLVPKQTETSYSTGLATILLLSGLIQLGLSMKIRRVHYSTTYFFEAGLSLVIASLLFRYPQGGLMAVALSLSFYFLIDSILHWIFFAETRVHGGWNWGVISSIISFLFGAIIVFLFPIENPWIPATMLTLELAMTGFGLVGYGFSIQGYEAPRSQPQMFRSQKKSGSQRKNKPLKVRPQI